MQITQRWRRAEFHRIDSARGRVALDSGSCVGRASGDLDTGLHLMNYDVLYFKIAEQAT